MIKEHRELVSLVGQKVVKMYDTLEEEYDCDGVEHIFECHICMGEIINNFIEWDSIKDLQSEIIRTVYAKIDGLGSSLPEYERWREKIKDTLVEFGNKTDCVVYLFFDKPKLVFID